MPFGIDFWVERVIVAVLKRPFWIDAKPPRLNSPVSILQPRADCERPRLVSAAPSVPEESLQPVSIAGV